MEFAKEFYPNKNYITDNNITDNYQYKNRNLPPKSLEQR